MFRDSQLLLKKKELTLKINPKINLTLCWILPIIVLGLMTVILNVKVFPITEGWWETYAWLSKTENIYDDIHLALPPLYTNLISIILEYTTDLINVRWVILAIYFLNVYLLYFLCKKISNSSFAIIGVFVSQILIINNNPVWLSKDYHTLVSLLVTALVILLFSLILNPKKYFIYSLIIGFITGFIVLTKQNIALVCLLSVVATLILNKNTIISIIIKSLAVYITSLIATLLIYSRIFGWSWVNVYLNNDSKGETSTVLLRFINDNGISNISFKVITLFLVYLLLRHLYLHNEDLIIKIKENFNKNLININKYLFFDIKWVGYFILTYVCYLVLQKNETTVFYSLMLAYFCINLYKYFVDRRDDKLKLVSIVFLMLAYAGTMTAGYNTVSLELLTAVFVTIFLSSYSKLFNLSQFAITIIIVTLSVSLFYTRKINNFSYNWWGYSTDSVRNSIHYSNNPKLKGISLDHATKEIFDATDLLMSHAKLTDTIFSYPSIPIFYWLYEKKPIVRTIVQWFDVMPSSHVDGVINDLDASPPKFIFWLKPPSFVYQGHLMMKKTQLPMNVIDGYIYNQLDEGKYRVIKSIPIIHGTEINNSKSFQRFSINPISYEFICKSCSNDDLNQMLTRGTIINYTKNMDYTNNSYIDIKFKNNYEASAFISKYNLFPIKQSDWIFYILERN